MSDKLREMSNYSGMMSFLIETAKKKGMRFDISDFDDGDIECLNEHVIIFRRSGYEFINRLFEGGESSITTEPM